MTEDRNFFAFEGMPPLSREAIQLHGFAVLNSVQSGRPGFVSDEYLNDITIETTLAAAELEAAGMWKRRPGGYFIVVDEMVKMVIDYNEDSARRAAECAQRRTHLPAPDETGSGWVLCSHCDLPLRRPDGGPVALPNGGPLGP